MMRNNVAMVMALVGALATTAGGQPTATPALDAKAVIAAAEAIQPTRKTPTTLPADDAARAAAMAKYRTVIEPYMKLAPGTFGAHPTAAVFPGVVANDVTQRESATVSVSPSIPRWQTTGLYANAGEMVTVTFPQGVPAGREVVVHVGVHRDSLLGDKQTHWLRFPIVVRSFSSKEAAARDGAPTLQIANAFGGPIELEVRGAKFSSGLGGMATSTAPAEAPIMVRFEHVVRAPTYRLGVTTAADWEVERKHPAPWAEFVGRSMILHFPSDQGRRIDNPGTVLAWWDSVVAAEDQLVGWPARTSQERVVPDVQISAGFMHSGYPFMCFLSSAPDITDLAKLTKNGEWGFFHELGHNHQSNDWTFAGQGEVTVNFFSLYCMDKIVGKPPGTGHPAIANLGKKLDERFADPAADATKMDPFVQLAPFAALYKAFGGEVLKATLRSYATDPIAPRLSVVQKQAIFAKRYSQAAGHNLGPLFVRMGYAVDDATLKELEKLPAWDLDQWRPDQKK